MDVRNCKKCLRAGVLRWSSKLLGVLGTPWGRFFAVLGALGGSWGALGLSLVGLARSRSFMAGSWGV